MRTFTILACVTMLALAAHALPTVDDVVPETELASHEGGKGGKGGKGSQADTAPGPCAGLENEVKTAMSSGNKDGLPNECIECLDKDFNDGCGLDIDHPAFASHQGSNPTDVGVCDHVGPDVEPCCAKSDRHEQNICILDKKGACDNISPSEEPCCSESSKEDQAKCYCQKTSPEDDPCCGLSDHTAQAACGAVMAHMFPMHHEGGKGSSGNEQGNEQGICDHVSPEQEPCCKMGDRHDQNTCILGKMGPCDNIDAADELCCAEPSKEAQAQCHCHKTSPQDDPCCGLSDHTAQAACGALMNKMDHDGKSADLMQINKLNAFWARTA